MVQGKSVKIKILFILNSLNCGGQENFAMNIYRNIDRCKFQIIFVVPKINGKNQFFEEEIISNGDLVYEVTSKSKNPFRNFREIYSIVKENHIKIVHRHSGNSMMWLDLLAAKLGGATMRIAHSHSSNSLSIRQTLLHYISCPMLNWVATDRYACSNSAGKWMYGKKEYYIVKNGIKTLDFQYDSVTREKIRSQLEISDNDLLIGHVGRFSEVKNHSFLLDIISDAYKRNLFNLKLLLVGSGELQKEIIEKARRLGVLDSIIFTGNRADVNELLQAIDVFAFPSLYEGLPLSLIEAQASGTPCIVSDNVSRECQVTDLVTFLSIKDGTDGWIESLINQKKKDMESKCYNTRVIEAGYDIINTVGFLEKKYNSLA